MSINWVMLSSGGDVVKLPQERIFYKVRSRIGLDITVPKSLQGFIPFSVKSDSGTLYVTNQRVIYLSARPTEQFKSFSAPVLNFEDTHITSSFFGPWSWTALVKPVSGGGIPTDIPRVEVRMTFKDGGHDAFREKFEMIKERLYHARELQMETGQIIAVDEPLPQYEAAGGQPAPSANPTNSSEIADSTPTEPSASQSRSNQPAPDEPPPDYEEAQAQAVGMRLEERLREVADRA